MTDFASRDLALGRDIAPHFSLFGLVAPAAAALDSARVDPVPYVPGDGAADNSKPFDAGDPTSGILFGSLTAGARVEVFDVAGRLVWRGTASAGGALRWDARNLDGDDAASGLYFAAIEDDSGGRAVKTLAIVR